MSMYLFRNVLSAIAYLDNINIQHSTFSFSLSLSLYLSPFYLAVDVRKEQVPNKKTYIRLWVHEAFRVFYDRLVDDVDRQWFFQESRKVVNAHFKVGNYYFDG